MQVIRHYAVPQNGRISIEVPPAFEGKQVEVQLVLAQDVAAPTKKRTKKLRKEQPQKTTGLEKLVGSLRHLTPEQNEKIDRELAAMRDEWERPIL
jgi:predicted DNA-binding antitoxin AbrB/MazE fold protein